ncbi:MAG: class I tRNA ligase family protein [Myxococcales bacterium]|nr:class I tRNA ligase family protein [Myxococcales bacterium]
MASKSPPSLSEIIARVPRPSRAVVTAGMPYANGPLHIGHLAGAQIPADIHARFLGMLIGRSNVLFVCGTDDHGSTSELAAIQAGRPLREFIDEVHERQASTLARYQVDLDVYSGTSRPDCFALQQALSNSFLAALDRNGLLDKRVSKQWYDPVLERFLADRFVRGRCPNPGCDNPDAYGDQCDRCGQQHDPTDLIEPRSAVSDGTPELRETAHWYLDMWSVSETLREWVESKSRTWRAGVLSLCLDHLRPSLRIQAADEAAYKALKSTLPKHKQRYARGKQVVLQFGKRADFDAAQEALSEAGIESSPVDGWAHRAITRDAPWGIPVPEGDADLAGKTLYVWPDSLMAPISFTKLALQARGQDPETYSDYWRDPNAAIYQFLGQDNVFFYVLMQGAMWLGSQSDPSRLPAAGELQLTDVFGAFHLMVQGDKMSKSRGNFYTAAQLLDERGYSPDQVRYYLAILGLHEKNSDFEFQKLDERNAFLAGPMNAAFEKPISAAHSKFGGRVPAGTLSDKVNTETTRIVARYLKAMQRADYPALIFEIERYARTINSLFAQFKPHDDRRPEAERADALYSSFFVLKNLIILLYPFVPSTADRVRESLRLPPSVFSIDELGSGIEPGHELGPKQTYFPPVESEPGAGA